MAMTQKERAAVDAEREALLTRLALRFTEPVLPDVPRPDSGQKRTKGFLYRGSLSSVSNVEATPACSSSVFHSSRSNTETDSQGGRALYSTRLRALKALRNELEIQAANRLRYLDTIIEAETNKS